MTPADRQAILDRATERHFGGQLARDVFALDVALTETEAERDGPREHLTKSGWERMRESASQIQRRLSLVEPALAAAEARVTELEAALRDCGSFAASHSINDDQGSLLAALHLIAEKCECRALAASAEEGEA